MSISVPIISHHIRYMYTYVVLEVHVCKCLYVCMYAMLFFCVCVHACVYVLFVCENIELLFCDLFVLRDVLCCIDEMWLVHA
jgi:hypothetical protein